MLKRLWYRIKHPKGIALIIFYIFTAACIAGAIVFSIIGQGTSYDFVAYIFYGLAAVTTGYTIYTVVILLPAFKRKITAKLKTHGFANKVMENYHYKTKVFALLSFVITIIFACFNLVSAIVYKLVWYGAIAAYYFVLVLFRGGVLYANKKCAIKYSDNAEDYEKCKWRIYIASGAFLIILEFAMIGAVTQMMLSERPTQSSEIMAITNAAYTFYKIITAVCNLVKARRLCNPVTQSLCNLNFADACMSIVSLTVLMISTFDTSNSSIEMLYVKSTVGLVGCAVIIAIAAYMIIRAVKILKSFNGEHVNE